MSEAAQYLYIIGARREGPLKIGITSRLKRRLGTLQVGNAEPLRVFWCYPCGRGAALEAIVHRILDRYRRSGEWFAVPIEVAMAALWVASHDDGTGWTDPDIYDWTHHVGLCVDCDEAHTFDPDLIVRASA